MKGATHQTAVVHSAPVAVSWPVWRCGHIPEAYRVVCFTQQIRTATKVCSWSCRVSASYYSLQTQAEGASNAATSTAKM
eukprot:16639-Heterococcus_DN1.PRE.1